MATVWLLKVSSGGYRAIYPIHMHGYHCHAIKATAGPHALSNTDTYICYLSPEKYLLYKVIIIITSVKIEEKVGMAVKKAIKHK